MKKPERSELQKSSSKDANSLIVVAPVTCPICRTPNRIALHENRRKTPKCGVCKSSIPRPRIILCDVSSSMAEQAGSLTKIEILKEALRNLQINARRVGKDYHIISFASSARLLQPHEELPPPHGSTDLAAGLLEAAKLGPERTILISDGLPNDKTTAFKAVEKLSGTLSIVFVGPDSDRQALEFLQKLAKRGQGSLLTEDLSFESGKKLLPTVEKLLLQ